MNLNEPTTTHFSIVNAAASTVKTASVVDDETALLPSYTEFLERMGYVVAAVTNGEDAISLMEERSYDLVLLDLRMPAKTGFEVLNEFLLPTRTTTSSSLVGVLTTSLQPRL